MNLKANKIFYNLQGLKGKIVGFNISIWILSSILSYEFFKYTIELLRSSGLKMWFFSQPITHTQSSILLFYLDNIAVYLIVVSQRRAHKESVLLWQIDSESICIF